MPILGRMSDEATHALEEVVRFAVQNCSQDVRRGVVSVAATFADGLVEEGVLDEDDAILVGGELAAHLADGWLAERYGQGWRNYERYGDFFQRSVQPHTRRAIGVRYSPCM